MASYEEFNLLAPFDRRREDLFVRAEGAAYQTAGGRQVLDLNEMRVVLGQNNAAFQQRMAQALSEITAPKDGVSTAKEELFRRLDETTGGRFCAAHLTSSGSEAVEWAVRLAKKLTGRTEVLSFWNSIHGRTYLSASISGLPKRKAGHGVLAPGTVFLPYPNCAHCPIGTCPGRCGFACLELAEQIYTSASAQDAAAVILEPCQGAGVVLPPAGWLQQFQNWARSKGALLIIDEIQSGMGRSGWMYLYQREGLEPDMLLLGKALGNGLHIAALLVRERPAAEALAALSGGAGDDPLACTAACEVFRQLEAGLLDHVRSTGELLCGGLKALEGHPLVRECRGIGLAAAMEFQNKQICDQVIAHLEERGYLPGQLGPALYCKPPYVITRDQVQGFLSALEDVLQEFPA